MPSSRTPRRKTRASSSSSTRRSRRSSTANASAASEAAVAPAHDEDQLADDAAAGASASKRPASLVAAAAAGASPGAAARVSRAEEKVELRSLNSRLASYVMRNKATQDEIDVISRQLDAESERSQQLELQVSALDLEVNTLQAQLKDLPDLRKERSSLLVQVQRMEDEHSRAVASLESDLSGERSRANSLEEQLDSMESEIKELRQRAREAARAEEQVDVLNRRVTKLEEEHEVTLQSLEEAREALDDERSNNQEHDSTLAEAETRARILEEEKQTLVQQVKDLTKSKKEAVAAARKASQEKLQALREEWKEESDNRAAEIEEKLRATYDESTQQLKQRALTLTKQNERLQNEMERMSDELGSAVEQARRLQERLTDLENTHSEDARAWSLEIRRLEEEVSSIHKSHSEKIDEFNELMDVKISLQQEIEQYRGILEAEEARAGINSPVAVKRPHDGDDDIDDDDGAAAEADDDGGDDGADGEATARKKSRSRKSKRSHRGKRARIVSSSAERVSSSGVKLDNVDLLSDCVSVKNFTNESVALRGWILKSAVGNQLFRFPDDLVLDPGKKVTVWSGKQAHRHHNPPHNLFWTKRFIWNNEGDTAVLINANNQEVSRITSNPESSAAAAVGGDGGDHPVEDDSNGCSIM